MQDMWVNEKKYHPVRLLGKGKGGYSYLVKRLGHYYVIKHIHHEEVSCYKFGNKIQAEYDCYSYLLQLHIRMPRCIYVDFDQELVLKQYIKGPTIAELIKRKKDVSKYIPQVAKMAKKANEGNVNMDYYPANFVVNKGKLYYVDYETSKLDKRYTFEVWGIGYWTGKKGLDK
jgi:tRNA A-37 threonylcarbamoyl transferase component Bud32